MDGHQSTQVGRGGRQDDATRRGVRRGDKICVEEDVCIYRGEMFLIEEESPGGSMWRENRVYNASLCEMMVEERVLGQVLRHCAMGLRRFFGSMLSEGERGNGFNCSTTTTVEKIVYHADRQDRADSNSAKTIHTYV